jgi:hypothetical protein
MAVSTISNDDKKPFSTGLIYFLGILGVALVVFFGGELLRNLSGLSNKAVLNVVVQNGKAEVMVNNTKVGDTPLESKDIKPGNNTVAIRSDTRQYQTEIKFLPSKKDTAYTVSIARDLGVSDTFSSGQDMWFDKDGSDNTLRVLSNPSGARVIIDNSEVGTTPFTSSAISNGNYDLKIIYPGHETSEMRINVQSGYVLNISVKLFPYPVTPEIKMFEGSNNLYNISIDDPAVTSDTQAWVKGIIYWNDTRGLNVQDVGMNKDRVFDYFIDYKGGIYDKDGTLLASQEDLKKLTNVSRGAYLGTSSEATGITEEARRALELLGDSGIKAVEEETAKIKTTPLGWLRVRKSPDLSGEELAKVNTGEIYNVLEKTSGWVKIKVSETLEGWVSETYVELSK